MQVGFADVDLLHAAGDRVAQRVGPRGAVQGFAEARAGRLAQPRLVAVRVLAGDMAVAGELDISLAEAADRAMILVRRIEKGIEHAGHFPGAILDLDVRDQPGQIDAAGLGEARQVGALAFDGRRHVGLGEARALGEIVLQPCLGGIGQRAGGNHRAGLHARFDHAHLFQHILARAGGRRGGRRRERLAVGGHHLVVGGRGDVDPGISGRGLVFHLQQQFFTHGNLRWSKGSGSGLDQAHQAAAGARLDNQIDGIDAGNALGRPHAPAFDQARAGAAGGVDRQADQVGAARLVGLDQQLADIVGQAGQVDGRLDAAAVGRRALDEARLADPAHQLADILAGALEVIGVGLDVDARAIEARNRLAQHGVGVIDLVGRQPGLDQRGLPDLAGGGAVGLEQAQGVVGVRAAHDAAFMPASLRPSMVTMTTRSSYSRWARTSAAATGNSTPATRVAGESATTPSSATVSGCCCLGLAIFPP
ncbi:MAG: hypothetical protein IPJ52_00120 [Rhodocyclaceae bacterium]|nr:hypothetical protein [Rhodocyclaceae bacterium]